MNYFKQKTVLKRGNIQMFQWLREAEPSLQLLQRQPHIDCLCGCADAQRPTETDEVICSLERGSLFFCMSSCIATFLHLPDVDSQVSNMTVSELTDSNIHQHSSCFMLLWRGWAMSQLLCIKCFSGNSRSYSEEISALSVKSCRSGFGYTTSCRVAENIKNLCQRGRRGSKFIMWIIKNTTSCLLAGCRQKILQFVSILKQ